MQRILIWWSEDTKNCDLSFYTKNCDFIVVWDLIKLFSHSWVFKKLNILFLNSSKWKPDFLESEKDHLGISLALRTLEYSLIIFFFLILLVIAHNYVLSWWCIYFIHFWNKYLLRDFCIQNLVRYYA